MGYEYQFNITKQDSDNLSRSQDGINSLETLFSAAPGFISKTNDIYSYTDQPENNIRWCSTVSMTDNGFCLCIYQRTADSLDQQLLNFLMREILNRCGRLEIEDA